MILAEHIEDCEHAHIQTKIINFLAEEGPKSKNPASYIRFIYNRVNLEKAVIRAASVSALASFAYKVPALRKNILILLKKCLSDSDDEVRERAFFFIKLLEDQSTENILGDEYSTDDLNSSPEAKEEAEREKDDLKDFIFGGQSNQQIDVDALEAYVL
jgi:coatomer protein complex subunit gamma